MTREHLLEAMGLLDDDLIREAEEPVRRKKWNREAWLSLAACLAIVLTIGYGAVHNGWWSANSSSGSSSAGATAEDWSGRHRREHHLLRDGHSTPGSGERRCLPWSKR